MKTVHYTFITWNNRALAAGFDSGLGEDHGSALIRRTAGSPDAQREGKVVDLNVWQQAANQDESPEEAEDLLWESGEPVWEAELVEEPLPAPRSRRSERAMLAAELVSTLSVVAAAVALIVRVLTF